MIIIVIFIGQMLTTVHTTYPMCNACTQLFMIRNIVSDVLVKCSFINL